jgi:hypothetical protein
VVTVVLFRVGGDVVLRLESAFNAALVDFFMTISFAGRGLVAPPWPTHIALKLCKGKSFST